MKYAADLLRRLYAELRDTRAPAERREQLVRSLRRQRGFLLNPYINATDPHFASVVTLLHFNGADASTTITDVKGKTWTATGTAAIDTDQSVFGGSSLIDPTDTSRVSTGSSADFGYGTGDFTIEFWARPSDVSNLRILYDQRADGVSNAPRPAIYIFGSGDLRYFVSNADRITAPAATLVVNTWHHIAISRVSGNTRLFVNGTQRGSTFADTTNYETSLAVLGQAGSNLAGIFGFVGHFDDLRVTKGVGRYSATFTPPGGQFPDA